jgi:hypothetical protein
MDTKRYPPDKPGNCFECVPCIGGVLPTTVGRLVPGGYDPNPIPTWWLFGGRTPLVPQDPYQCGGNIGFCVTGYLTGYVYVIARHSYTQPCLKPVRKQVLKNPKRVIQGNVFPFPQIYTLGFFFKNQIPTQLCTKPRLVI